MANLKPDVVALQEVKPQTVGVFREQFSRIGFEHFADSFPRRNVGRLKLGRQFGEMVASRWSLDQIASTSFGMPWNEKVLSVTICSPWGDIELHTVHVPNGSEHGRIKVDTFEAIYQRLARNVRCHRILCGDFNSPQDELANGEVLTWGQTKRSNGHYEIATRKWDGISDERWDLAERSVLEGLKRYDLQDSFRQLHGYRKKAFSFETRNRGRRTRRRFDHILASGSLGVTKCDYLFPLLRLSDHAPIVADFKPKCL